MPKTHAISKPWQQDRSVKPVEPPTRFTAAVTLDGWEVVDQDGRSVTDSYRYERRAQEEARNLNDAAAVGKKALARALGCIEDDDDWVDDAQPILEAF